MSKDLSSSKLDRQNILNNTIALVEIKKAINLKWVNYNNHVYFTKEMLASFFSVDIRTIERYINKYNDELKSNGYTVLKGKELEEFFEAYKSTFATDINVGGKIRSLSVFDFRAFLNMAMLLVESQTAFEMRKIILDIVIDTINQKTGGKTKYINQRDIDFIGAFLQEENYRKEFTDALRDYVDMGNAKYAIYTDKIYQSIFKEKAKEYRQILKISQKESIRKTFYSEVLTLVSSYEYGLAEMIKSQSMQLKRKLSNWELSDLFDAFELLPLWKPLIISARTKMASRDMALRDAYHYQLKEYIKPLDKDEYEKFLGDPADELEHLMQENAEVLKRLKES